MSYLLWYLCHVFLHNYLLTCLTKPYFFFFFFFPGTPQYPLSIFIDFVSSQSALTVISVMKGFVFKSMVF